MIMGRGYKRLKIILSVKVLISMKFIIEIHRRVVKGVRKKMMYRRYDG